MSRKERRNIKFSRIPVLHENQCLDKSSLENESGKDDDIYEDIITLSDENIITDDTHFEVTEPEKVTQHPCPEDCSICNLSITEGFWRKPKPSYSCLKLNLDGSSEFRKRKRL